MSPLLHKQEPRKHELAHLKLGGLLLNHPSFLRLSKLSHPSFLKYKMEIRIAYTSQVDGGFPGITRGKGPTCLCRRPKRRGFNPWVRNIPWSMAWQFTQVFLPGESPWTEDPGRLQSIALQSQTRLKRVSTRQHTHTHTHIHTHMHAQVYGMMK